MRETRYRGKSIMTAEQLRLMGMDESGWVYGNLITNGDKPYIVGGIVDVTDEYLAHEFWIPVDLKTVGQYTGLKDKNGIDVFEGDITHCKSSAYTNFNTVVRFGEYEQDGSGGEYSPSQCIGFYAEAINKQQKDEFDCRIVSYYMETASLLDFESIEVIGNVYENPELLEVTE